MTQSPLKGLGALAGLPGMEVAARAGGGVAAGGEVAVRNRVAVRAQASCARCTGPRTAATAMAGALAGSAAASRSRALLTAVASVCSSWRRSAGGRPPLSSCQWGHGQCASGASPCVRACDTSSTWCRAHRTCMRQWMPHTAERTRTAPSPSAMRSSQRAHGISTAAEGGDARAARSAPMRSSKPAWASRWSAAGRSRTAATNRAVGRRAAQCGHRSLAAITVGGASGTGSPVAVMLPSRRSGAPASRPPAHRAWMPPAGRGRGAGGSPANTCVHGSCSTAPYVASRGAPGSTVL